jgi:16S rRNA (guanine527-N7)-methyltransferase
MFHVKHFEVRHLRLGIKNVSRETFFDRDRSMHYESFLAIIAKQDTRLSENVSRETFSRLVTYVTHLQKWNKAINLIAPSTEEEIWHRHIFDSLQLGLYIPRDHRILDFGSGGGLPGIVLACLGYQITLIESDQRKAIFLRETLRLCDIPQANVIQERVEKLPPQTADTITARALAPLETLLEYAAPHLGINSQCLFPKGAQYSKELHQAKTKWQFECLLHSSLSDSNAVIIQLSHLTPVQHL